MSKENLDPEFLKEISRAWDYALGELAADFIRQSREMSKEEILAEVEQLQSFFQLIGEALDEFLKGSEEEPEDKAGSPEENPEGKSPLFSCEMDSKLFAQACERAVSEGKTFDVYLKDLLVRELYY